MIGLWCNGSTTDFDSVSLGSKPGNPTKGQIGFITGLSFLIFSTFNNYASANMGATEELHFINQQASESVLAGFSNKKIFKIIYCHFETPMLKAL